MAEESAGMKTAVADYQAGMARFLGLTPAEAQVLGERYQQGLQQFVQSLNIQARQEGLIPAARGRRKA